jgi:hypothetical protein
VRHSPAAQILAFGERQKVAFFNSIGKWREAQLINCSATKSRRSKVREPTFNRN